MKKELPKLVLLSILCFFTFTSLSAQKQSISTDLIIGKWILKSALFNGTDVNLGRINQDISFEFSLEGNVVYVSSKGDAEEGKFIIKENKLIDPEVPEYPSADILSLSETALVLLIKKEADQVRMTFEPVSAKK